MKVIAANSASSGLRPPAGAVAITPRRRVTNALASIAVACLLFAGSPACADTLDLQGIGGRYRVPVTSLKEARFRATMRQQYDFSCGSAAIATLLTHQYGIPTSEQQVFENMFSNGDQLKIRHDGFSLLDMKRYLLAHGFDADGFVQPLDKLVEAKLPAIVLVAEKGYHHFVVVKGLRDGRILIGDPATGTRSMARNAFEAIWVNQLLFVIHNHQEIALFNDARDWRSAPAAPLASATDREAFSTTLIPKLGPGDF